METGVTINEPATLDATVTRRAVVDPLRLCHLRCDFCYYLHGDMTSVRDWPDVRDEIQRHAARGCAAVDVTGGEPLRYPQIVDLIRECRSTGLSARIISSLIAAPQVVEGVLSAGVCGFLVSMHGALAATHDAITHVRNARSIQWDRLRLIADRGCATLDLNYVMVLANQAEIAEFAREHAPRLPQRPRVVNFINFNPHYQWRERAETADLVVDLRVAGPQLDAAIDTLEAAGVGVNVRYFPMCALREEHRKNVCNDLHVAFDSGEWNNGIADLSAAGGHDYGVALSLANEEKGEPCASCDLQWICGGANRVWHEASGAARGEQLLPVSGTALAGSRDFLRYRRENQLGMV